MKECDRLWEVDALREGRLSPSDAASFSRHRAACAECRARFAEDERLAELGTLIDPAPPSELVVRRARAQLLRSAAVGRPARRLRVLLAAAAMMALAALVVAGAARWRRVPALSTQAAAPAPLAAEPFAGTITAAPGVTFRQTRDARVERVHLDEGTIDLVVRRQEAGERFLVELPDGEIEVRGTHFEVTVRDGATASVRVLEGLVAFRRGNDAEVLLGAAQAWTPAAAPIAVDALPRARPANGPKGAAPAPASTEYEAAMVLYRAKEWDEAARRFAAFAAAHPSAPEAEDAAFLEASAVARAGRSDAAALVAERFIARHPASFHAKDAAILVARAARDRGDCERARSVLAPWRTPPRPDVTAALGGCAEK